MEITLVHEMLNGPGVNSSTEFHFHIIKIPSHFKVYSRAEKMAADLKKKASSAIDENTEEIEGPQLRIRLHDRPALFSLLSECANKDRSILKLIPTAPKT